MFGILTPMNGRSALQIPTNHNYPTAFHLLCHRPAYIQRSNVTGILLADEMLLNSYRTWVGTYPVHRFRWKVTTQQSYRNAKNAPIPTINKKNPLHQGIKRHYQQNRSRDYYQEQQDYSGFPEFA